MSEELEDVSEDIEPSQPPTMLDETPIESPALDGATACSATGEQEATWAESLERALAGLGDRLSQRLDAIQTLLERDARAEASRERVVDRLHAELQEYKHDLLLKVQRPIFLDLIQLHDDIGKMVEVAPGGNTDPDRAAAVRGMLESIQVAIEDILYRQGVEPFVEDADTFDPRRQRAVATVGTDDLSRNKMIAARLRKGFQTTDKVIRPELVSVYTFRSPAPANPPD